jgi:DNA primase catalytic subunit
MTTDIAGHDIHWWVKSKGVTELSDFERDRIADLIS